MVSSKLHTGTQLYLTCQIDINYADVLFSQAAYREKKLMYWSCRAELPNGHTTALLMLKLATLHALYIFAAI